MCSNDSPPNGAGGRDAVALFFFCSILGLAAGCSLAPGTLEFEDGSRSTSSGSVEAGSASKDKPSDCGKDHPKVGQMATFQTLAHGVSGSAFIIDNCTVELRDFSYDGGGVNTVLYASKNGDFGDDGQFLSTNLLKDGGYDKETLTFPLPKGVSLDDIEYLGIWCVPFKVSFGDGKLE